MTKKFLSILVVILFIATGGHVLAQHKWSEKVIKQIDELKMMASKKLEMAESIPGINKIKAEELKSWLDQGKKFVLLDNRTGSDYQKEHIPGAIRLAPDDLQPDSMAAEKLGLKKDAIIVNY